MQYLVDGRKVISGIYSPIAAQHSVKIWVWPGKHTHAFLTLEQEAKWTSAQFK